MTLEGPMSLSARKQGPREAARRGRPHPGREHHPAHRSCTRRPCHMCVDICRHPSPPCTPEHVHARACARRPAQDSSRAQHPGESSVSLLPFSLEDIVLLLSKQTDSCLQLLQEPTGIHGLHSGPLSPHLPPATPAPRAGVGMVALRGCPGRVLLSLLANTPGHVARGLRTRRRAGGQSGSLPGTPTRTRFSEGRAPESRHNPSCDIN